MQKRSVFNLSFALILSASILFPGIIPVRARPAPGGPTDAAEVGAFMDGVMASQMDSNHVVGAVVAIVKDGAVLYANGYGYSDLESRKAVDPASTLFRPGSVSKLFVWTSAMQLVEQGQLDLDADVNIYLDFTIPATFPEPVRLRTIMSHTPGFEDTNADLLQLSPDGMISLEEYLKKNLPARVFAPGRMGAYSNYATALTGYIVERISGTPFYEYVEKNIFAPLGMQHASFRQPLPEGLASDMSGGYSYSNGEYLKGGFEFIPGYPPGALSASGLDMAKFMIAHLQNGKLGDTRILQEATALQMHSQLYTPDKRMDGMAYGFFENEINGQRVISHGGDTLLFHSGLFLLPEQNVGLFVSTNSADGAIVGEAVMRAFMDRYYPPKPVNLVPAADFDTRIAQYTGEYYISRGNFTTYQKFMSSIAPITVSVDENMDVLLSIMGEITRFVEVEPGLLVSKEQPDIELALQVDDGQVSLHMALPLVLIKSPWYGSLILHLVIFAGGSLLFTLTIYNWLKSFISGLRKHEQRPLLSRLARLSAVLFGMAFILFLVLLGATMLDVDPVLGAPRLLLNEPPAWFWLVQSLPMVAAIFGIVMLPFVILAWAKRFWTVTGRMYYSFLSLFALVMIWGLVYWQFVF